MIEYSNPFRPTRFELHDHPLLWASPRVKSLQARKSFYLHGARGSGKTSILRSLHWRERCENQVLREQLSHSSPWEFLAVYFRLPDFVTGPISRFNWNTVYPTGDADAASETFFSIYIELIAIWQIIDALLGVTARGGINASQEEMDKILAGLTKVMPCIGQPETLEELADGIFKATDFFRKFCTRGGSAEELELLPYGAAGTLLVSAAQVLVSNLRESLPDGFHFKVCIDECEALSPRQQRFLNSLVRKASAPVFWLVSYADKGFETSATTIHNQTLADADRVVFSLDDETDAQFINLCNEVSSLRCRYSGQFPKNAPKFSLKDVLGATSVNQLIEYVAKGSVSPIWQSLEETSEKYAPFLQAAPRSAKAKNDAFEEEEGVEQTLYYQSYLIQRLPEATPRKRTWTKNDQKKLSSYLRRKQRAALIALTYETGANIPYSGWQVVASLSDGCIRDYLELMGQIFDVYTRDRAHLRAQFLYGVPVESQRAGILASARNKLASIVDASENYAAEGYKFVLCLGELTRKFQTRLENFDALRTAERGIFVIDPNEIKAWEANDGRTYLQNIISLINECEAYGFLRIYGNLMASLKMTDRKENKIKFRLHRRFAPAFGISYRGPYEEVPVPAKDIIDICLSPSSIDPAKWAARVEPKVGAGDAQVEMEF